MADWIDATFYPQDLFGDIPGRIEANFEGVPRKVRPGRKTKLEISPMTKAEIEKTLAILDSIWPKAKTDALKQSG